MNENEKTAYDEIKRAISGERFTKELTDAIGGMDHTTPERIVRAALSALSANTYLLQCDRASIYAAIIQCAQMGLEPEPTLQHVALVPRKGKVRAEMMYKGLVHIAWNSGRILSLEVGVIHEKDTYEYERGTQTTLRVRPFLGSDRGAPIAYYSVASFVGGGQHVEVMSREEIEDHRKKYSASGSKGAKSPWDTDFDAMAKKTVLRRASAMWPKSLLHRALAVDVELSNLDQLVGPGREMIDVTPKAPMIEGKASRLAMFAAEASVE